MPRWRTQDGRARRPRAILLCGDTPGQRAFDLADELFVNSHPNKGPALAGRLEDAVEPLREQAPLALAKCGQLLGEG